jgi:hypothetical protein
MYILDQIIIPIIVGAIVTLIVEWISRKKEPSKKINWKAIISIGICCIIFLFVLSVILLPPYKITDPKWCMEGDKLRVTGHIETKIFGFAVSNYTVQIKIYEEGKGDPPFKDAIYIASDEQGNFEITYPRPFPENGKGYLINTAYKYDKFYKSGLWEIKDFYVSNPKECNNKHARF